MLTIRSILSIAKINFLACLRSLGEALVPPTKTMQLCSALLFSLTMLPFTAQAQQNSPLDFTAQEQLWLQEHKQVSVAYEGYFPPYSFLNDEKQLEGLSIDLFNLLAQKTGLKFNQYPAFKWDEIYAAAKQHKIDIIATMVNKEERQEWFNFTQPYIFKSLVIITRDDDTSIHVKSDIKNKTVALVKDFYYVQTVISDYPSITPVYFDTIHDALNAVSVGDADVALTFFGASHYLRQKYLLSNLKYSAIFDKNNANESIAIGNNQPILSSIISKALASIPEVQLQQLRAKWLPVDYMEELIAIELTDEERLWIKNHPNIRLGVDPEYAPFEYMEQQQYMGMAADYIKLLNQRLKLNMQVTKNLSWNAVIEGVKAKRIDVLPVVSKTPLRTEFLSFTEPYLNFHRVIVTRVDMPFISSVHDLKNLTVAAQVNTSHHEFLIGHLDITPALYDDLQQSLLAVATGSADAYIGNVASATYWIRKLNLTNLKIAAPASINIQKLHFAVRPDWPELVSILQKGLNSISPRQKKLISEKWLSIEYNPIINFRFVWEIAAVFSILIFAFIGWNILLNRKVKLRTSQLIYSANYDKLTQLPNRFLILDRLSQKINETAGTAQKIAVVSIDINDFKMINNVYGHQVGDQILCDFSQRLSKSLRKNQHVGRISGNQFLMIQSHVKDSMDPASMAEQIIACTTAAFSESLNNITISTSLGITLYPSDGNTAELLLKHAEAATQHAKRQAQGYYTFYTERLNHDVLRKLSIEKNLQCAIEHSELEVYFQPKLEPTSKKIVSFEALLRWTNKELGIVSPVEFIPIAEKSDLINDLGLFVINQSLAALESWRQKYKIDFSMAINLSPVQFHDDDLLPNITSILNKYTFQNSAVEFEITEGVLLTDYTDIDEKLRGLEACGVSLAMDDFGTGYSSLSYLRKYRFNTLKIDREFITELPHSEADSKLVSAIIAMAHQLDMKVVAEGVETEQQNTFLIQHNCDLVQGWLFSKALNFNDLSQLLDKTYGAEESVRMLQQTHH